MAHLINLFPFLGIVEELERLMRILAIPYLTQSNHGSRIRQAGPDHHGFKPLLVNGRKNRIRRLSGRNGNRESEEKRK